MSNGDSNDSDQMRSMRRRPTKYLFMANIERTIDFLLFVLFIENITFYLKKLCEDKFFYYRKFFFINTQNFDAGLTNSLDTQ
jgi:hypothetical protein